MLYVVSVSVSVCLSARSLETPLPRLVAGSPLRVAVIIIIITCIGKPYRTIDLPRVLGHL